MAIRKDFIITRKTAEIKNTSNNKNEGEVNSTKKSAPKEEGKEEGGDPESDTEADNEGDTGEDLPKDDLS